MRRSLAILVCLSLAVLIAGCGSSSNGLKTGSVTKADYIISGDTICTKGNADLEQHTEKALTAMGVSPGQQPSKAQVAQLATTVFIPNIQQQLDSLRALTAPSADAATLTKLYDALQADIDKLKDEPAVLASGGNPFGDVNAQAAAYGFQACGNA